MKSIKDWLDADTKRTQKALADTLGVSPPTVNEWVHGSSNPSSQRLHDLHKTTRIPLSVLIADCAEDAKRRKQERAA